MGSPCPLIRAVSYAPTRSARPVASSPFATSTTPDSVTTTVSSDRPPPPPPPPPARAAVDPFRAPPPRQEPECSPRRRPLPRLHDEVRPPHRRPGVPRPHFHLLARANQRPRHHRAH